MKTTTLDKTRRGVFPPPFEPGDVLERRVEGRERIVFILQKPAETPKARLVRRGGRTYLVRGRAFTQGDVEQAMKEFP